MHPKKAAKVQPPKPQGDASLQRQEGSSSGSRGKLPKAKKLYKHGSKGVQKGTPSTLKDSLSCREGGSRDSSNLDVPPVMGQGAVDRDG